MNESTMGIVVSLWKALPQWNGNMWINRWLGRKLIGRGWYLYPTTNGWSALNREQFDGWYNYRWDGTDSLKRLFREVKNG